MLSGLMSLKHTPVAPIDPGPLPSLAATANGVRAVWGTSFPIGNLIYTMRVEAVELEEYGLEYFYDELGLPRPSDGAGLLFKFDNSENELEEGAAYRRLPRDKMLSMKEFLELERFLVGGVLRYMEDKGPPMIVGVPNDSKLERWYSHLATRVNQPNFCVEMRRTGFHPRRVALVRRR
ncbi:hypothetical protein [Azospirillum sp.]|uniref:hypothetical protein n=1 Tax=Azospirillum sp. TaxID=34012 RepID=UPI002D2530BF|nr:hypothetical protein [Azospirillum sp.]HYF88242.1 hypothetical protein [Azospirillum sp.]